MSNWEKVDEDRWMCTSCNFEWTFSIGTPEDNGANFCPRCGTKLNQWETGIKEYFTIIAKQLYNKQALVKEAVELFVASCQANIKEAVDECWTKQDKKTTAKDILFSKKEILNKRGINSD